jgi:hydroxybutyrate-dimer hydrolase
LATGWEAAALATAASSTAFDLWRAVAVTYASAYLRAGVGAMPCRFAFRAIEVPGVPAPAVRAAWWPDGSGIPPNPGVALSGGLQTAADPTLPGVLALRNRWDGSDAVALRLHAAVDALAVGLPRADLPVWVVHGAEDGLIPAAFTSDPYIAWLREQGRTPRYWRVPHAQHFDAFLRLPGFGDRYVPLLPYGYCALDAMYAHAVAGTPLPDPPTPQPRPRGTAPLTATMLDLQA